MRSVVLPALLCTALVLGMSAADAAERVAIPFAAIGNIRDWQASSTDELYIQAMNREWYRATFWGPCQALPFAIGIAFVTESDGALDRFGSILVEGERCWFKSFERADPPPRESAR